MTLYLIIALVPLAGSLIAGLFGNKIGRAGAHSVTILGVAVSAVLSAYVLWGFIDGSRAKFDENVYTWLTMGGLDFSVGFLVDTMTAMMMVVVTGVSYISIPSVICMMKKSATNASSATFLCLLSAC